MQTYNATPSLPTLIEQLQNIQLLVADLAPGDYVRTRSIERLCENVAGAIALLDDSILEAITLNPTASCQ